MKKVKIEVALPFGRVKVDTIHLAPPSDPKIVTIILMPDNDALGLGMTLAGSRYQGAFGIVL